MIYRSIIILSFVTINGFILFGISQIISFLNTGADRSTMLRIGVTNKKAYLPKIVWKDTTNPGRPIEKQTIEDIKKDYINAWHVKNLGYATNDSIGIPDFYTQSARKNILKNITYNKENDVSITSSSLKHKLYLDFYSADGQLVAFEDQEMRSYSQFFNKQKLIHQQTHTENYKVIMLREDGFWKIRHLTKTKPKKTTATDHEITKSSAKIIQVNNQPFFIKGINYYPQKSPWDTFGDAFDAKTIDQDFSLIRSMGLNTIRIFVQYEDFGKENVHSGRLQKLKKILDIANANDLKVMITLFDFYGNYAIPDWTFTHRHLEQIVTSVKDHSALLAWDIKNEPDLDFANRNKKTVLAWLKEIIWQLKQIDPKTPVTIGWSSIEAAMHLQKEVDFISFHYYKDIENFKQSINLLKNAEKPIVLQEFGWSSNRGIWAPFGNSKKQQAYKYKEFLTILDDEKIPYLLWTLYDFEDIPNQVNGRLPWLKNKQKHFGLIDTKGTKKPAFEYVSEQ